MAFKTEVLKRSPLWIINFIFRDIQIFASQIADKLLLVKVLPNEVNYLTMSQDLHIKQILQHLTDTTRCLLNYAYVNNISIKDLDVEDEDQRQAIATWNVINAFHGRDPDDSLSLLEQYSDRSYMYCMLLWNCSEQILQNKVDVFEDTIYEFIEWMVECSNKNDRPYDDRIQPLLKLMSQIGHFHIHN